jgi:elongation factor Ts
VPEFTAADVAALRKQTGAGMMDSKQALTESDGDMEAAKDWLRAKGLAGASKRAGRAAEEGAVDVLVRDGVGAIVELTAETDFVAKSNEFTRTVEALSKLAVDEGTAELSALAFEGSTVEEHVTQLAAKLGEHVVVGRTIVFETSDGLLDGYKHRQFDRYVIGVLVELAGVDRNDDQAKAVAHDVALHVASAAPRYLTRDDVPADVLERERAVLEERTRNEGKPEQALAKIVEGRLNAFYKENALLEQGFVKEPKQSIAQLVGTLGPDATVRRFARVKIGEE